MKIRVCDWLLLIATILILASGIQLEITSGSSSLWVWIHIILGILFFFLIRWHVHLHFRGNKKPRHQWFRKQASNRWLAVTGVLAVLSGLIAMIHWIAAPEHSVIGAVHGKIGFLFIVFVLWHVAHRARFYLR